MTRHTPTQDPQGVNRPIPFDIIDWGLLPYANAHARQLKALEQRIAGNIGDTVFLVEHPHVYTYGRGFDPAMFRPPTPIGSDAPVKTVFVERGGDVTYHGPGQLVAYPVLDVRALTGDLHRFLHWLEDAVIRTIAHWGITGEHHPTHTGVWVGNRKIASIGVAVRKWVSYHGAALNVSTDLRYFGAIDPCGLPAEVMTTMDVVTGESIALDDVKKRFADAIRQTV